MQQAASPFAALNSNENGLLIGNDSMKAASASQLSARFRLNIFASHRYINLITCLLQHPHHITIQHTLSSVYINV